EEIYSYADLEELATRVGAFLVGDGVATGDRAMLLGKHSPQWSMAYFGVIKTGATAVPAGHESTVAEIVNVARASGAVGILIGDDLLEKRPNLTRALRDAGVAAKLWPFQEVFEIPDQALEEERARALA